MISEKDKIKLSIDILNFIYKNYQKTTNRYIDLFPITASYISNKIDEHDIELALNLLKADELIDFKGCLNFSNLDFSISITDKGYAYCSSNEHKVRKWFSNHTFDIFNLLVAIVLGVLGIIF